MKSSRHSVLVSMVIIFGALAAAAPAAQSSASHSYVVDDPDLAGVMAADDERVAALMAPDRARLEAIHSPELRYAHSIGTVDDYEGYIQAVLDGVWVHRTYDYQHRTFNPVAPGITLMTGRVLIGSRNADGPVMIDLNFLAVWRNENGVWRFLAWQSSRNPPAAPPPPPPPSPPPAN